VNNIRSSTVCEQLINLCPEKVQQNEPPDPASTLIQWDAGIACDGSLKKLCPIRLFKSRLQFARQSSVHLLQLLECRIGNFLNFRYDMCSYSFKLNFPCLYCRCNRGTKRILRLVILVAALAIRSEES